MFSAFERIVAMRYLRPRRKEGFVSVIAGFSFLGIALGVATLIIVMSVMNGFREELMSRILGLNGHLTVSSNTGVIPDYDALVGKVIEIPLVERVTPYIEAQVMATRGDAAMGAIVRGMRSDDLAAHPVLADSITPGALDEFHGIDVAIIGTRMAERMGVFIGDGITLVSAQGTTTVMGNVPRMKTFRVIGVFEIGMYEYDSGFIYVPLEAAQLYFRLPDAVNSVEVMVQDAEQANLVGAQLFGSLDSSYRVLDWQRTNSSFFNAIQVERNVMFLILTLIIVVAAFNIISGQIMLVKNKGRDIAILRTMGASRGAILRIFFMSGASIGIVGTGLGVALGLAFSKNIDTIKGWLESLSGAELFSAEIYFLSKLPAIVDPMEVFWVCAMALGLSFLATIYPAWRAARLDPVEALRYE
ncbi:MAG: lipoprotein-releasing ABC transporter permease subunit [Rhodospirillaceae bacterium]|nr:lipoprotein-releasing ABC transporter permease subunit [Rhodospirillaceae bacterium]